MNTLPDILSCDLKVLSIGLNPSLASVSSGFYFANPRNRFWKALNASALVRQPAVPGPEAMHRLLVCEGIGFTDLVKRPTRGAADLRAADYRDGATRLSDIIELYRPRCAWFHGKLAYRHFARYAGLEGADFGWGLQSQAIGGASLFVTPNPSPANAVFSLADLVGWYNRLADSLAVQHSTLSPK
ncbi:mismatch-specific DNA-glycosylase [Thiogranum longum]